MSPRWSTRSATSGARTLAAWRRTSQRKRLPDTPWPPSLPSPRQDNLSILQRTQVIGRKLVVGQHTKGSRDEASRPSDRRDLQLASALRLAEVPTAGPWRSGDGHGGLRATGPGACIQGAEVKETDTIWVCERGHMDDAHFDTTDVPGVGD